MNLGTFHAHDVVNPNSAYRQRPETEYAEIELRFVNIGNNFLKKVAESRRGAT